MAEHATSLAKASVSLSFLVSGVFLGSSAISVPALLSADNTTSAARQWAVLYNRGLVIAPSLALAAFASAAASSYLYSKQTQVSFSNNKPATTILVSGLVTVLSMPWTIVAMKSTNDSLLNFAKTGVASGKERIVRQLIEHWGTTNYIRAVMPLVGAAIGVYYL